MPEHKTGDQSPPFESVVKTRTEALAIIYAIQGDTSPTALAIHYAELGDTALLDLSRGVYDSKFKNTTITNEILTPWISQFQSDKDKPTD